MIYKIVMPQLSDSMEEGKLISWKKKVGDRVKVGDVIAEVESDKAIMEVQSFKNGVLSSILVKEGEEVPVGSVIATIETEAEKSRIKESAKEQEAPKKEDKAKTEVKKELKQESPKEESTPKKKVQHIKIDNEERISPKARAKAAALGVDIEKIAQNSANKEIHAKDVEEYILKRYFTPKALKLLKDYHLDSSLFKLDHKIESSEVQEYIKKNEIPLPKPLTSMQKAIIANVSQSAQKPVFHIYETIDATLILAHPKHTVTAWLIKIFAKVMMKHPNFRAKLHNDTLLISPNASISVAVANDTKLYMPVVKDANLLSIEEISKELEKFKETLKNGAFAPSELEGGNFGISNLGMLGIKRFDAMINKDESGIAAVGAINENQISLTLTIDHRVINGYEAALFMQDLQQELKNPLNFKE